MSHLHDKVSGLVDGELAGTTRSRALSHLRRCEDCRAEVRATLEVKRRVGGLAAAEPPGDLLSALGTLPSPELAEEPLQPRSSATGRRVLAGAATVSAALLGVAYVVGAPDEAAPEALVTPPVEQFTADFAGASGAAPLADPAVGGLDTGGSSLTMLAVGQLPVPADPSEVTAQVGSDDARAVAVLQRASRAGRALGYSGERRVTSFDGVGPSLVTMRVNHVPGQGTTFDLSTLGNDARAFVASQDAAQTGSVGHGPLALLVDTYDLAVAGSGRVADRPSTVVTASQQGTVIARFWLDTETGLLLRRDLYEDGMLVRSSQFTSLELSRRSFFAHLPPEPSLPTSTELSMTFAPSLNDQGWACPEQLIGDYELVDLEQLQGDVVHATYTDGLSTVAIYEQRGQLDPRGLHGYAQTEVGDASVYLLDGLPAVAVWESAGTIYSLVSDAPDVDTSRVLRQLPHEVAEEPSTTERVTTGLRRLGSYLNPAD